MAEPVGDRAGGRAKRGGEEVPRDADRAADTRAMRASILLSDPAELGIGPTSVRPNVGGLLMETGYPDGTASLVVLGDRTVSLYTSAGGGVIGAGEHGTVWREGNELLDLTEQVLGRFTPAQGFPMPRAGRVRFHVLTFTGPLTAEAGERELADRAHPLSDVFYAAHDVITAMREIAERPDSDSADGDS